MGPRFQMASLVVAFFALLVLSFYFSEDAASPSPMSPHNVVYHRFHVDSLPLANFSCPYCNLDKCTKRFCYTIKIGLRGESHGFSCVGQRDVARLLREPLLHRTTDSACQSGKDSDDQAICWCKRRSSRKRPKTNCERRESGDFNPCFIWQATLHPHPSLSFIFYFGSSEIHGSLLGELRPRGPSQSAALPSLAMTLWTRLRNVAESARLQKDRIRKWSPLLLFTVLLAYLFLGAAAFLFFEQAHHETFSSRTRLTRIANRRSFARSMSMKIFNDTRNLLIIIDREQTSRVQDILVENLKRYEELIATKLPEKTAWNLLNSLNYAYGLLLTIGHGQKTPETIGGQVFALVYATFGIPFFLITLALIVQRALQPLFRVSLGIIFTCFQCEKDSPCRRQIYLWLFVGALTLWTLTLTSYLYFYVFESFWTSLFAATLAGFTVQVLEYDSFSPCSFFVLLLGITVSLVLALCVIFLFVSLHGNVGKRPTVRIADEGTSPPKFTVVVDEAGESKLAE